MGKDETLNLKAIFLPDEGYAIYDLDISNAEMRTVCAYSLDRHLIDAFNSDKDLHCLTGVNVCNGKFTYEELLENKEDKTTEEYVYRQISKRVNFGTIYGIGKDALKAQLWNSMRVDVSVEEAQHYLDQFFVTYPGVKTYMDNTEAFVDRHNFVYTYFGRRRRFPYATYFKGDQNRVHRQAVNARIQSTSSDIVLSCLKRVNQYLRSRNDGSCVLLTVHDSILFQAPIGAHTELKPILDKLIVEDTHEQCPWLPVKWKYDVGWGPNYGDTHGKVE